MIDRTEAIRLIQEIDRYISLEAVKKAYKSEENKRLQSLSEVLQRYRKRKIIPFVRAIPNVSEEELPKIIKTLFRSLTSYQSYLNRAFPGERRILQMLEDLRQKVKNLFKFPPEQWEEFLYIWAVETDDATIGSRNLELHFESQIIKGNEEVIIDRAEYIFQRLIWEEKDLSFMFPMKQFPLNKEEEGLINGLRSGNIPKPQQITFRLKVIDGDYTFLRVNRYGFFPDKWWELPKEQLWAIIKVGLKVRVVRGTKGRFKKGAILRLRKKNKKLGDF